nr:hypothetical protein Iba_chr13eCG9600 [Ipomoea batatas]
MSRSLLPLPENEPELAVTAAIARGGERHWCVFQFLVRVFPMYISSFIPTWCDERDEAEENAIKLRVRAAVEDEETEASG